MTSPGVILLIAYDMRDPRRLRRLHGKLKKVAVPVQKSVFAGYFTPPERRRLTAELRAQMHPRRDDVRIYVLAGDCLPDVLGVTLLPEGLHWLPEQAPAISLLHHSALLSKRRYPSEPFQAPASGMIERLLREYARDRWRRLLRYLGESGRQ